MAKILQKVYYITAKDMTMLACAWQMTEDNPAWDDQCDLVSDGIVNMKDFARFAEAWNP
jgi:hypothetical protein